MAQRIGLVVLLAFIASHRVVLADEERDVTALVSHLDHLPMEYTLRPGAHSISGVGSFSSMSRLGGGFGGFGGGSGRPLSEKGTIKKGTETLHLNRTYSYDANGLGHVTDKSKSSNKDPKATTYQYDFKETLDQIGRTIVVQGTMTDSTGETIHLDRVYRWDVNGIGTVTDKSWTTHKDPAIATYKYDLTEVLNQIFQRLSLKGTVTSSSGRVIPVDLSGTGRPKS